MRLFTFLFPIFLFSCINNNDVTKEKNTRAGNNTKLPAEVADSTANTIAYAKSLIDTATSLIKRSIVEKIPARQSNHQLDRILKEYDRVFTKLTPIGKAETTKYRVEKIKELKNQYNL